jgi:hypothetical protein
LVAPSLIRSFSLHSFSTPTNYSRSTTKLSKTTLNSIRRHIQSHILSLHSLGLTMAEVMAQQGFGLGVPASRQDVVSALLNDYGNSFGRDDASSPSAFSPVPADKELPPPPPPRSDGMRNKPLPAVQRAEQRMSAKFQLRGKRICF